MLLKIGLMGSKLAEAGSDAHRYKLIFQSHAFIVIR